MVHLKNQADIGPIVAWGGFEAGNRGVEALRGEQTEQTRNVEACRLFLIRIGPAKQEHWRAGFRLVETFHGCQFRGLVSRYLRGLVGAEYSHL